MTSVSTSDQKGYSLIEVVVAVTIVAVLVAMALPNYSEYVRRGHRVQARSDLFAAQLWLERAATANGEYPKSLPEALKWSNDGTKRYSVDLVAAASGAASYQLKATRKPGTTQSKDKCGDLTLSQTGERGAAPLSGGASVSECWNQ